MSNILQNRKILITRERNQAKVFSKQVLQYGGEPVEVPLLKISCKDRAGDRQCFQSLSGYKWIFFTSANGVNCFFQLIKKHQVSPAMLKNKNFAVVGHKTEIALKSHGFAADFMPSIYNAEHMASEFLAQFAVDGPFLLVRGNRSRDVLPEQFSRIGINFDAVEVYETTYNDQATPDLNEALAKRNFDFITFTSPSTVDAFMKMKNDAIVTQGTIFVCIGTTTEQRAGEAGLNPILTPEQFTIEGMLDIMQDYVVKKG